MRHINFVSLDTYFGGQFPWMLYLGLDVKSGCLFCAICNDFIYDGTIDGVYTTSVLHAEEKNTRFQGVLMTVFPLCTLRKLHSLSDAQGILHTLGCKWTGILCSGRQYANTLSRYVSSDLELNEVLVKRLMSIRSKRITKSRSNVLHECCFAMFDTQSSRSKLLSQWQAQSQTMQTRPVHLLWNGQAVRGSLFRPSLQFSPEKLIHPKIGLFRWQHALWSYQFSCHNLESFCRTFRSRSTGCPWIFHLRLEPSSLNLSRVHQCIMQLCCPLHVLRTTTERREMRTMWKHHKHGGSDDGCKPRDQ